MKVYHVLKLKIKTVFDAICWGVYNGKIGFIIKLMAFDEEKLKRAFHYTFNQIHRNRKIILLINKKSRSKILELEKKLDNLFRINLN